LGVATVQLTATIPVLKTQQLEYTMSILQEFKAFAVRGNVIDMAVGVIVGASFGKIVSSFVADIVMPPIGLMLGGANFADLVITLKAAADKSPAVVIGYGKFLQTVIDFAIIAFVIFMMVKFVNSLKKKAEAIPPAPPAAPVPTPEQILLAEIRDLLKPEGK
jgi:large conductance mechanosensitive channel